MKVAIIGSRDFNDSNRLKNILDRLNSKIKIDTIVSGGAKGADQCGYDWAKENNIEPLIFEADWNDFSEPCVIKYNKYSKPYNALAGFKRNKLIIENADIVIAFWNGKSPGTKDSLDLCKKLNKKYFVIKF